MTARARYSLCVLFSAVAAAGGLVLSEIMLRRYGVTSLQIVFFSSVPGGIILLVPAVVKRPDCWRGWPGADWGRLAAAALMAFAVGFLLLYAAIDSIGAGKATMLSRLETVFVVALAVVFLGEYWSLRHWMASLFALAGAVLINFDPSVWQLRFGPGELLAVLAALAVAAGIVTLKPLLDRRDGQFVTGSGLLLGALFLVPCYRYYDFSLLHNVGWLVFSLLIVRAALLGVSWLMYNIAMPHIGASRCSVLFLTAAFFTVALQVAINAIEPSLGLRVPSNLLMALVGGAIIALGIIFLQRQEDQRA